MDPCGSGRCLSFCQQVSDVPRRDASDGMEGRRKRVRASAGRPARGLQLSSALSPATALQHCFYEVSP